MTKTVHVQIFCTINKIQFNQMSSQSKSSYRWKIGSLIVGSLVTAGLVWRWWHKKQRRTVKRNTGLTKRTVGRLDESIGQIEPIEPVEPVEQEVKMNDKKGVSELGESGLVALHNLFNSSSRSPSPLSESNETSPIAKSLTESFFIFHANDSTEQKQQPSEHKQQSLQTVQQQTFQQLTNHSNNTLSRQVLLQKLQSGQIPSSLTTNTMTMTVGDAVE